MTTLVLSPFFLFTCPTALAELRCRPQFTHPLSETAAFNLFVTCVKKLCAF